MTGRFQAVIDTVQLFNRKVMSAPALAEYPTSLTTAHLPLSLTWPGGATVQPYQTSLPLEIDVIVEAIAQGDYNVIKQECLRLMDAMDALYRPFLNQGAEPLSYDPVVQIDPDSPLQISAILPSPVSGQSIQYPFHEYHGFKINLTVQISHLREARTQSYIEG